MNKKKQSRSYNQHQLKIICDKLCDRIEDVLEILEIEDIKSNGKMLVGNCPIHNGDNKTAFNLYPDGDYYRGNWKCRTHNCEQTFKSSIIGFIRGVLSRKKYDWLSQGDKTVSFEETIVFIENFLNSSINDIKISNTDIDKKRFLSIIKNLKDEQEKNISKITRANVISSLEYPCKYFIDRGFDSKILERYDVGICNNPEKEMYNRAVVPIYDQDHKYMVGCSGRSIFEKCSLCDCYHDSKTKCPEESFKWKYPKWKHNSGFLSQNHLYNFWYAKKHILKYATVIIVESPGNVWKLEQAGIHNSVAIFGSSFSDRQKILLDGSGAMTIVTIMDNDNAGKLAAENIAKRCKNTYNIKNIEISKADIAEMSLEEIERDIKEHL